MEARLIGFEGETARVIDVRWPDPPPVVMMANPRFGRLDALEADVCDTALAELIRSSTVGLNFKLERLVGTDDGGPFLVYRRSA